MIANVIGSLMNGEKIKIVKAAPVRLASLIDVSGGCCECVRVEKLACLFIDTDWMFSATRRHQCLVLCLTCLLTLDRKRKIGRNRKTCNILHLCNLCLTFAVPFFHCHIDFMLFCILASPIPLYASKAFFLFERQRER